MKTVIFSDIYKLVRSIPTGKVCTYSQLSYKLKLNNPRVIGYVLHKNPSQQQIPCHRVVNVKGEVAKHFAFGGGAAQRLLLEKEGIKFQGNHINLKEYQYLNI